MILFRYIILAPVIALLLNLLLGRWWGRRTTAALACGSVFASFLICVSDFLYLHRQTLPELRTAFDPVFSWIRAGGVDISVNLVLDPLSGVMCLIITGVGFLIHLYSVGYMWHDAGFRRFFIYLNLFIAFMLTLVLADNLLVMFVGWEGVGLCSYLLIGFWHTDLKNAAAGKKAFVVNRIGDAGFILGMLMIFSTLGTLNVSEIGPMLSPGTAGNVPVSGLIASITCLLLFVGAAGKSAQIPLYVWLPDAMAGPTPVSALIHAATMVTAGVYMVARLHALFALSAFASTVIAVVGACTAVFAAIIGLAQNDIKKVLAYSTVSQLGYMFLAVGVGAYTFGIFHLTTHAFFKALLFLGAGSVIHSLSGEQDIRKMGGIMGKIPITFVTFLIGTLAIAGIPPLAGFFSKDEILVSARVFDSPWISGRTLFTMALAGAFMTAFYMGRLFVLTFLGAPRMDDEKLHHVHESPWTMYVPLIVLAALAAGAGFALHHFESVLEPMFGPVPEISHDLSRNVMFASVGAGVAGLALAYLMYALAPGIPGTIAGSIRRLHRLVENKFYIDELYDWIIVRPLILLSRFFSAFDRHVIDRIVNWTGGGTKAWGFFLSFLQSGNVSNYAVWFLVGVAVLLGVIGGGQ